jgi:hypothetical protein
MAYFLRSYRASTIVLFLGLAIPLWAQQDGPLPVPTPPEQSAPQNQASQTNGVQPPSANPSDGSAPQQPSATAGALARNANAKIEVPTGTHIPLVLHNAISTRSAKSGDPVYFETLFPVMIDGRVVIPAGSYVSGEVTESKRPGRVKGRGELMIRLNTLILPNAYMVNLNAVPSNAGTGGSETTDSEGKVIGPSNKGGDAGTIAKTTAAGAGIGGVAGQGVRGAGIGAGAGLAVGLAAVLLTRGPEAELPRGSTVEAVLDRGILLDADKVQFTGPGQASTLAGPPNREKSNPFPY